MDENEVTMRERVTRLEEKLDAETEQRKKLDAVVEDMRNIVSEIRYMRIDLKKIDEKVESIENKPAKRWDSIIAAVIGAVGGGLGGALLSLLSGG